MNWMGTGEQQRGSGLYKSSRGNQIIKRRISYFYLISAEKKELGIGLVEDLEKRVGQSKSNSTLIQLI